MSEVNLELDFLDFPSAWAIQRAGIDHKSPDCSAVQTRGALLCDCGAVSDEWRRRRSEHLAVQVAAAGAPEELTAKLEIFDEFADQAVQDLVVWLLASRAELVALARGRHVDGHYRYGDHNFLEWNDGELRAETAQELADAIVYQSRALARAHGRVAA